MGTFTPFPETALRSKKNGSEVLSVLELKAGHHLFGGMFFFDKTDGLHFTRGGCRRMMTWPHAFKQTLFCCFFWRNFETAQNFDPLSGWKLWGWFIIVEQFLIPNFKVWGLDMSELVNHETPLKTNMTLGNPHFQEELHLHSRWIFHCHLSFRGVMNDESRFPPMFQTPQGHDDKNLRVNKTSIGFAGQTKHPKSILSCLEKGPFKIVERPDFLNFQFYTPPSIFWWLQHDPSF